MAEIAKEVKHDILRKAKEGVPVMQLCREYGVSDKTIYNWLKAGVERPVSLLEIAKLRKENDQLKQVIGVLTFELEKTKKKFH